MKIEYIEGDLLSSPETLILHGCNAKGAFASGFAGAIRKQHPFAYQAYMNAFNNGGLFLGSIVWASSKQGNLDIANAITQPTYGRDGRRHVDYDAIRNVMETINLASEAGIPRGHAEFGYDRVAMPMIGAALGGGDWSVISSIVEACLTRVKPVVYVLPGNSPTVEQLRKM